MMTNFVSFLQRSIRTDPDWSEQYVDYEHLKKLLQSFSNRRFRLQKIIARNGFVAWDELRTADDVQRDAKTSIRNLRELMDERRRDFTSEKTNDMDYIRFVEDNGSDQETSMINAKQALHMLSKSERSEFCDRFDKEVEKAALFYYAQLVHLSRSLSNLSASSRGSLDQSEASFDTRRDLSRSAVGYPPQIEDCVLLGNEIIEIFAFVVANIITMRQLLIRYDAYARAVDGLPLTRWYLKKKDSATRSGDHLHDLFHVQALNELERSFVVHLQTISSQLVDHEAIGTANSFLKDFSSQFQQFNFLLDKTLLSLESVALGRIGRSDRIISSLRTYFLVGSVTSSLYFEPTFLSSRGRHLKKEMEVLANWRETKTISIEDSGMQGRQHMDLENVLSFILNLVSCFLYMMNSYIVEPSSAYYISSMGGNDALAGLLIGATPWAALVSAIGYSLWTNRSYKEPVLFAASLTFMGNMIYSVAYEFRSIPMCLVGRVFVGLGAPRVVNRRYVADATPFSLRSAASSTFAMVTALGAATGPFAAIILDMFEFEFHLPFLGIQKFNGMTGPGFFMASLWLLYIFGALFFFREPTRSGIDELKQREDLQSGGSRSPGSESTHIDSVFSDEIETFGNNLPPSQDRAGKNSNRCGCFRHMNLAIGICMSLIFFKRLALESIVASTSIITKHRYGWTIKNVGTLHFVNGVLVIPLSAFAGWLSYSYEDRYLIVRLLSISIFGLMVLVDVSDFTSVENETYNQDNWLSVGPARYIAGCLIVFGAIECCESFVASLMSKVVPSELATGTFNSGLLATLVGTSGRASGDLFIAGAGYVSLRNLLNLLLVPSTFLMLMSLFVVLHEYDELEV